MTKQTNNNPNIFKQKDTENLPFKDSYSKN